MRTIEVDFDVFKELTLRRPNERVTENDVLRQLLGLPAASDLSGQSAGIPHPARGEWVSKGVRFPPGTEFRAVYKGQTHLAKVENGGLVLNGKRFGSPSAAAYAITKSPTNGWKFWECRLPGQARWQIITALRGQSNT